MRFDAYMDFMTADVRFEAHMKEIIEASDEYMQFSTADETRGIGEWVDADDGLPAAEGVYRIRGTAFLNGEKVGFEDEAVASLRVEDYEPDYDDEFGFVESYEIVPHFDVCHLEKKGYTDICVAEWRQMEQAEKTA